MDSIKVKGAFVVDVIDNSGNIVEHYQDNNLVVTLGKTNAAKLLGGHADGKKVSKIAVGTNPADPTVSDTSITGMYSKAIDGASYPDANSVQFNWSLDNAEANGMSIVEFGLLNDSNALFARKVRTAITKTSAVRLVGTWKITIN
ncbi:MAG: hypothetical protein M9904_02375 [Chitinophagaceae bacterium]|nr:hypothetical protein [Chitinophagaceae bacterium]